MFFWRVNATLRQPASADLTFALAFSPPALLPPPPLPPLSLPNNQMRLPVLLLLGCVALAAASANAPAPALAEAGPKKAWATDSADDVAPTDVAWAVTAASGQPLAGGAGSGTASAARADNAPVAAVASTQPVPVTVAVGDVPAAVTADVASNPDEPMYGVTPDVPTTAPAGGLGGA